jgi:secretion/DNA translocation related CpaE-like protein
MAGSPRQRPLAPALADRVVTGRDVAVVSDRPDVRALVSSAAAAVPGTTLVAVPASGAVSIAARFPAVALGTDALPHWGAPARAAGGPRLAVVAGVEEDLRSVWPAALAVGADVVIAGSPDDVETWLASLGVPDLGAIGVVGGRGGAGASTAAVALARAASSVGAAILVDADPVGGGIDLALGAETVTGLRWPEVAEASGAPVEGLLAALPVVDGIHVLAHTRDRRSRPSPVGAAIADAVLATALGGGATVVADLPRRDDPATRAVLGRCSLLVVVVPAEVRACAATCALLDEIGGAVADVRLLVRGPAPAGLSAEDVAAAVGVPSFAEVRPEPGVAAALDRGEPVAAAGRSPLRAWATAVLTGRRGGSP